MGFAMAGFACFLLGVILLICYPISKRKNKRCTAQTKGTVTDIRRRYNSNGSLPSMLVYSYSVDGVEYRLKSTAYNKEVERVGDTCTIWYDPSKPKVSQTFHYTTKKFFTVILIIGIVLVLLGLVLPVVGVATQA